MKTWLKQLLGDQEGRPDELALLAVAGFLVGLGLQIYTVVWQHHQFHFDLFCAGLGSGLSAVAVAFGLRNRLAPNTGS